MAKLPLSALALLAASFMVQGCDTAREVAGALNPMQLFEDEEEASTEPAPVSQSVPGEDDEYPSVGSVPERPATPQIARDLEALKQGLEADRANARYTDQVVRERAPITAAGSVSAVAPPATLPTTPPPAPPTSTIANAGAAASAATAQQAAAPQAAAPQAIASASTLAPASPPVPPPATPATAPAATPAIAAARALPAGPAAGQILHVATIYFPNGGATLTSADRAIVTQVADLFKNGGREMRVVGHASSIGNARSSDQTRRDLANYKASLDRATAAAAALWDVGVPQPAVQIAALGARQPRFEESNPAGVSGNQRVEFFIRY